MSWAVVACMEEKINAYRVFVRKPEEEGPLGRPMLRRNCNIRLDLKKYDGKKCHCIDMAYGSDN
jgi:hypothetical protein